MKRVVVACAAVLALVLPRAAIAQSEAHLSWDSCFADQWVENKSFACNTNSGTHVLVGSYIAPAGVEQLTGNEVILDIRTENSIPDWWRLKTTGSCRQTALSINFVPAAEVSNCRDPWAGGAAGGFGQYYVGFNGSPNRARITAAIGVYPEFIAPLEAGVEYFAFNLVFSNIHTVGTGACDGCTMPALLGLSSIKLIQPPGMGDFNVYGHIYPGTTGTVRWQGGFSLYDPVRNTTWGGVKALYH